MNFPIHGPRVNFMSRTFLEQGTLSVKKIPKVLITTSGIGSRLGEFTNYTNKSLVKVGDKLALSHIIESYPVETNFVITLGHFGQHVQDFLSVAYPEVSFEFVNVENYKDKGSSLGLSMLSAAEHLQEPFIFHASDTLILGQEFIQSPTHNWVAGSKGLSASQYASFDVSSDFVMNFHNKGKMEYDYLHIGLIGVFDYKIFWETLVEIYELDPLDSSLNDLAVLATMKSRGAQFKFLAVNNWADMGNTESLLAARRLFGQKHEVLEKPDESISFLNDSVVKFFANEKIALDRVARAKSLDGLVPKVTLSKGNFYRYDFVGGELASDRTTPQTLRSLLIWSEKNLWKKRNDLNDSDFHKLCLEFYKAKTVQRINSFLDKSKFDEDKYRINGLEIPSIFILLDRLDFEWICDGEQSQFHGDFILDNIIKTDSGFKLIDWRQDFGGRIDSGDMYYDLAKLNHSLVVNHEIVNQNNFYVEISGSEVYCEIYRKHELVEAGRVLADFAKSRKLDYKKIGVLSSLIWLNMAPLHHHPFDLFLFNFGKLNLWRALEDE